MIAHNVYRRSTGEASPRVLHANALDAKNRVFGSSCGESQRLAWQARHTSEFKRGDHKRVAHQAQIASIDETGASFDSGVAGFGEQTYAICETSLVYGSGNDTDLINRIWR
jgi:hypothetical protein